MKIDTTLTGRDFSYLAQRDVNNLSSHSVVPICRALNRSGLVIVRNAKHSLKKTAWVRINSCHISDEGVDFMFKLYHHLVCDKTIEAEKSIKVEYTSYPDFLEKGLIAYMHSGLIFKFSYNDSHENYIKYLNIIERSIKEFTKEWSNER